MHVARLLRNTNQQIKFFLYFSVPRIRNIIIRAIFVVLFRCVSRNAGPG